MTPAFGSVEAKALHPYFVRCSNSVSHRPLFLALKLSVPLVDSSWTNGAKLSRTGSLDKLRSLTSILG